MWDGEIAHTPRVPPFSVNNWWGNQLKLKPQHRGTAEEAKGGRASGVYVVVLVAFWEIFVSISNANPLN